MARNILLTISECTQARYWLLKSQFARKKESLERNSLKNPLYIEK